VVSIPRGFSITETMKGDHHFVDPTLGSATDRLFYFRLDWGGAIADSFNPGSEDFLAFEASGVIFVSGLTPGEVPCSGTLHIDYLRSRTLRYELDFEVEGEPYRYVGEKVDVNLLNPLLLVKTHTTCYGTLTRGDGSIVSRSVAHFEPRSTLPFLMSFRLS
jgi:hypothetical protein